VRHSRKSAAVGANRESEARQTVGSAAEEDVVTTKEERAKAAKAADEKKAKAAKAADEKKAKAAKAADEKKAKAAEEAATAAIKAMKDASDLMERLKARRKEIKQGLQREGIAEETERNLSTELSAIANAICGLEEYVKAQYEKLPKPSAK
jgi:hypothetical protein